MLSMAWILAEKAMTPTATSAQPQVPTADMGPTPDSGPDFSLEAALGGIVAGVDEAGRGPWAGPVVAAAVILTPGRVPMGLDDSKRLRPARRAALYAELFACARVGVGAASVAEIDRLNILQATLLAMGRAMRALGQVPDWALIDGLQAPELACPARAVVKGDRRSLSIAAASIVAKVVRDRLMARLGARYPEYGWAQNAGYGTRHHRESLNLVGVSPHHRKSFAPIRKLMTQDSSLNN